MRNLLLCAFIRSSHTITTWRSMQILVEPGPAASEALSVRGIRVLCVDVTSLLLGVMAQLGFWLAHDFHLTANDTNMVDMVEPEASGWLHIRSDVARHMFRHPLHSSFNAPPARCCNPCTSSCCSSRASSCASLSLYGRGGACHSC
jgi:hypothetical protein